MWSKALCGRVKQPCCTWHRCLVIAIEAELWTRSDVTALRVGATWMVAWELDPHIHFSRNTVTFKQECDSTVLICLCHHGHVIPLLQHLVFVNIVNTHWLAQWKKASWGFSHMIYISFKTVHFHSGVQIFSDKCDFFFFKRWYHPVLFVHVLYFSQRRRFTGVWTCPLYAACCAIRKYPLSLIGKMWCNCCSRWGCVCKNLS